MGMPYFARVCSMAARVRGGGDVACSVRVPFLRGSPSPVFGFSELLVEGTGWVLGVGPESQFYVLH